jgi:hypothetical protein
MRVRLKSRRELARFGLLAAGLIVAFGLLGASCSIPKGVLKVFPGGEEELVFTVVAKAGDKKEIRAENPANGPNIPAELGAANILEGGVIAEGNFKVVAAAAENCVLPGEFLNRGESCRIGVEFVSGARPKAATFRVKFGPRNEPNAAEATMPVKSE